MSSPPTYREPADSRRIVDSKRGAAVHHARRDVAWHMALLCTTSPFPPLKTKGFGWVVYGCVGSKGALSWWMWVVPLWKRSVWSMSTNMPRLTRLMYVARALRGGGCPQEPSYDAAYHITRIINHQAKGPAPPGSILFSVPVGVRATKKRGENEENQEKEQGTSHLTAVRELRPDLAGWYTGGNSGGAPPRSLYVELAAGGCTRARGPCAECRVRRACWLLVHTPHGRRHQLVAPPP